MTELLVATNIRKTFANGSCALELANLTLPTTGLTLITGANGSGKTTLLRILAGLTPADAGTQFVYQQEPRLPLPGTEVSLLAQQPYLLTLSVQQNVCKFANQDVSKLLEQTKLWQLREQPARKLSVGQQKLVALTRTCATAAPLLLLDEPFANLDSTSTEIAVELIQEQAKTRSIVITAPSEVQGMQLNYTTTITLAKPNS